LCGGDAVVVELRGGGESVVVVVISGGSFGEAVVMPDVSLSFLLCGGDVVMRVGDLVEVVVVVALCGGTWGCYGLEGWWWID
jgi:hypothetical protein